MPKETEKIKTLDLSFQKIVHKMHDGKEEEDQDPKYASFIASTASVDRHADVVDQDTWQLDNFRAAPVILFNHNQHMLPIGKATRAEVIQGQLELDVEFDMDDELGAKIANKVHKGFLNGVSVGFIPKTVTRRSDLPEDHYAHGERGLFLQNNELLETSIVTIAANARAGKKNLFGLENADLQEIIRSVVRSELLSKNVGNLQKIKDILEVEETADSYIVTFSKQLKEQEQEQEQEQEFDLINYLFEE